MGPSISLRKQSRSRVADNVEEEKREKKAARHRVSHHALPQVAPARHAAMADGAPATDLKATEAYVFLRADGDNNDYFLQCSSQQGMRRQAREKISAELLVESKILRGENSKLPPSWV